MATKIGSVYVEVGADASGLGKQVGSQVDKELKPASRKAGENFAANFGTYLTRGALATATALGAATVTALVSGVNKGLKQQTATLVLEGLYDDAEMARRTIKGLNEVAANSPLNADAFQAGAASLAYAGIKGDDVVKIMENVGKSIVAVGGTSESIDQVSDALLSMVNKGKVDLVDLNRISAAGVPIFGTLAETMGLSMEEVRALGSEGKISLEEVTDILRDAPGEMFADSLRAGEQAARSLGNQTKIFWGNLTTTIGDRLQPVLERMTPIFENIAQTAVPLANTLMDGFEGFLKVLKFISPVLGPIVIALGTFLTLIGIKTAAMAAYNFVIGASVGLWKALTAAMKANPIIRVISILVALGAALVVAYKKSETFRNFVDKMWEVIKKAFSAAWEFIEPIVTAIGEWFTSTIPPILERAKEIFLGVWDAISNAFSTVWDIIGPIISNIITWVGDRLPGAFSVLKTIAKAVLLPLKLAFEVWWGYIKFVFNAVKTIITDVVIPAVMWLWENAFQPVLGWIGEKFSWLWENVISPVFSWISEKISDVWENYLQPAFQAIGDWIVDVLAPAMMDFWENVIKPAWEGIKNAIDTAWSGGIKPVFSAVKGFIDKVLGPVFTWLWKSIIVPAWKGIKTAIEVAWSVIKVVFNAIKSFIDNVLGPVFNWLWKNVIVPAWDGIKNAINVVWNFLRDYVFKPLNKFVSETVPNAFTKGKDLAISAWEKIKSPIQAVWTFLRDKVFDPLRKLVRDTIPKAFTAGKNAIKSAWDGVKRIAAKPVNFLINTVYNKGIRRMWNAVATKFGAPELGEVSSIGGYAKGGPVYGPGGPKDDMIPAMLSNQEHVWTAAEVKGAGGHHNVLTLRQMAKAGQIPAFAEGGWWSRRWNDVKNVASGGWNSIKNAASHLADPIKWIKSGIDKVIGGIGTSGFSDMLRRIPGKVFDALKTKVTDVFSGGGGAAGVAGPLSPGGWRRPASGPVTSEFGPRWGGFHAGIDLGGTMPTFAARAGRVTATGGGILAGHTGQGIRISHGGGWETYYGHNPYGGIKVRPGQEVASGQHVGYGGSTGRVTGPHHHFGLMRNGRFLNPRVMGVFDKGGMLEPKMLGFNATTKPEAVLTPPQTQHLKNIASQPERILSEDMEVRLHKDDLDYLVDGLAVKLWPVARAGDMVNDLATRGRSRQRRGSDR